MSGYLENQLNFAADFKNGKNYKKSLLKYVHHLVQFNNENRLREVKNDFCRKNYKYEFRFAMTCWDLCIALLAIGNQIFMEIQKWTFYKEFYHYWAQIYDCKDCTLNMRIWLNKKSRSCLNLMKWIWNNPGILNF